MKRSYEPEKVDLAGNSPKLLADDLSNLRLRNRCLRGTRRVVLALQWALRSRPLKPVSILDVNTSSVDIPAAICAWAKRRGGAVTIFGVQADPVTVAIAAECRQGHGKIDIVQGEAGAARFGRGAFDFVAASRLLHHFSEAKITDVLKHWATLARRAIVSSDLLRHLLAYHGIGLLTKLTMRSIMPLTDSQLSVRRALTLQEWRARLCQADIGPVKIFSVFPFRMAGVIQLGVRR